MKLYGSTNRKSFNTMKIRAALSEAGAPYQFVPVDLAKGEQKTADFMALNPHGKIPVLVDDGFVLPESDAILWYVGERYPQAGLLPPPDGTPSAAQGRARVLQWCNFASTGLYQAYAEWRTYGPGDAAKYAPAIADAALAKIARAVAVMQTVLGGRHGHQAREYLAGAFSLADLANAAIVQSLALHLPADPIARAPAVQAWYARITARPAWRQALADT
jgi:glutathione S-transferase